MIQQHERIAVNIFTVITELILQRTNGNFGRLLGATNLLTVTKRNGLQLAKEEAHVSFNANISPILYIVFVNS